MLTKFGQFVRQLRIAHQQLLKDMADVLKVSPAFLSAVEGGKKSIPGAWAGVLIKEYGLREDAAKGLQVAIDESQRSVTLDLEATPPERRAVAVAFARDFSKLSDVQIEQLRKTMASAAKKER